MTDELKDSLDVAIDALDAIDASVAELKEELKEDEPAAEPEPDTYQQKLREDLAREVEGAQSEPEPEDHRVSVAQIAEFAQDQTFFFAKLTGTTDTWQSWWDLETEEWNGAKEKVLAVIQQASAQNPYAILANDHDRELAARLKDGWRYGETFDAEAKTHPLCLPFAAVPDAIKARASYHRAVIISLLPLWKGY